ncbi:MAG: serine/threonine-protein phosphatase, partial [Sphingobacteriales bacterium]
MAENFFGLTDTGKTRDNNEDTFIAQPVMDNRFILACVIDGVGGYQGGEVAAEIAREEIIREFERSSGDLIPQMIDAFKQASHKISAKKEQDKEHDKMACVATLVIADVQNNQFYYAHVGDTRLYLLRDGSLIKISKDHSFVGFLEDSGRLTETAAMNHPKRNEINKALGFSEQIDTDDSYIETGQSPFLPGDMLLLCSDGLTDMVDKSDITAIITKNSTLEQKATALIDTANNNGGRDNITVVLVQNDKTPQRISATMPVASEKKNDTSEKDIISVKEEPKVKQAAAVEPVKKGGSGLTILLAVFCLLLLGTTAWLYMQWQKGSVVAVQTTATARAPRNAQEVLLQDAFDNATGDTLTLSDTIFKGPIMISDITAPPT